MLKMSSELEENTENTCVVCFRSVEIFSVGYCDHMVCYECSTRMRVLCLQNECPICRQDLPKVIFTTTLKPFNDIKSSHFFEDKKYKICFENKKIQNAFYKLMEHNCSICPHKFFRTFQQLYDHMKREHDLYYCDLCVEHLKIFSSERRCYTRNDLAHHKRKGDKDDKSHRGHPMCEFCQVRYVDNDFLYRHLRKDHLFCHFCDADGRDLYYSSYDYLVEHFREEHYLCEEGACSEEKFTPVFRTEIDLKAHKMVEHGKLMGKAAARQARLLELEFTLKPRPGQGEGANRGRSLNKQRSSPEDIEAHHEEPRPNFYYPTLNLDDFPSLPSGPAPVVTPSAPQRRARTGALTIQAVGRRNAPLAINDENFPVLPEFADNSSATSVRLNINQDRSLNSAQSNANTGLPSRNVSIHVNHKVNGEQNIKITRENFPALPSDSGAPKFSKWVPVPSKSTTADPAPKQEKTPKPPPSSSDFPELTTRFHTNLNLKSNEPLKPDFVNIRNFKADEKNGKKASSVLIPVREGGLDVSEASTSNLKTKVKKKKSKTNLIDEKSDTAKKKNYKEINDNFQGKINNIKDKKSAVKEESGSAKKLFKPLPTAEDWFEIGKKSEAKSGEKKEEANVSHKSCKNSNVSRDEGAKNIELAKFIFDNFSGPSTVRQELKAPPGFDLLNGSTRMNDYCKPPPGFAIDFPYSNDLTFTNSSGQSFAIPTNYNYIPPLNFENRNKNLVTKVSSILSNGSKLDRFRSMSALFRQDLLSAEDYCSHCIGTMGDDGFREVFPELLVLLPDINKQQELYKVFLRFSKYGLLKTPLHVCEICRQVLCESNVVEHANQHTLQETFPLFMSNNWM